MNGRALQPLKAAYPIRSSLESASNLRSERDKHPLKQELAIVSTLDGMHMDDRALQPLKALSSIRVSLEPDSNVTVKRGEHSKRREKQDLAITLTLDGTHIDNRVLRQLLLKGDSIDFDKNDLPNSTLEPSGGRNITGIVPGIYNILCPSLVNRTGIPVFSANDLAISPFAPNSRASPFSLAASSICIGCDPSGTKASMATTDSCAAVTAIVISVFFIILSP
jgi:hypothetical protein